MRSSAVLIYLAAKQSLFLRRPVTMRMQLHVDTGVRDFGNLPRVHELQDASARESRIVDS